MEPYLDSAEIVGETEIDGMTVYEISFELDLAEFMDTFMGEELSDLPAEDIGEFDMSVRYWLGQDDLLTRKAVIELDMEVEDESLYILMNMSLSDYGKPVKIPDPESLGAASHTGF